MALKGQSGFGQTLEVCKSIYNSEGCKGFYRGAVQPFYDMLRILPTFAAAAFQLGAARSCVKSHFNVPLQAQPRRFGSTHRARRWRGGRMKGLRYCALPLQLRPADAAMST